MGLFGLTIGLFVAQVAGIAPPKCAGIGSGIEVTKMIKLISEKSCVVEVLLGGSFWPIRKI